MKIKVKKQEYVDIEIDVQFPLYRYQYTGDDYSSWEHFYKYDIIDNSIYCYLITIDPDNGYEFSFDIDKDYKFNSTDCDFLMGIDDTNDMVIFGHETSKDKFDKAIQKAQDLLNRFKK